MIKGTGIDIIEIDRIQSALEKYGDKFLNRIYTKSEIAYCHRRGKVGIPELAARFAAKEALSKALGVGIRSFGRPNFGISWKDEEIASNNRGKPCRSRRSCFLDKNQEF